jgi:hypothetical protein
VEVDVAGIDGKSGPITELIAYDKPLSVGTVLVRSICHLNLAVVLTLLFFVFRTFLDLAWSNKGNEFGLVKLCIFSSM